MPAGSAVLNTPPGIDIIGRSLMRPAEDTSLSPRAVSTNPDRACHEERIQSHFDSLANRHDYWERKNRYYHELLRCHVRFLVPEGRTVLDLGCGDGSLLASVKPALGIGLDISPNMIALARERHVDDPSLEFHVGNEHTTAVKGPFDYVILSDVVGDLYDIESTFKSLREVCNSETRVIVSYYNFLWEPILRLSERLGLKRPQKDPNWLSPNDLVGILHLAGYEVIRAEKRTLLPKNVPLLTPLLNRFVATLPAFSSLCLSFFLVGRKIDLPIRKRERSVSVVIPTLNERGNVEAAVERIPKFGRSQEIIFVDGHSTDGTAEKIQEAIRLHQNLNIKLLRQEATGKADAVRTGFAHATGEVLMILDGDLTVPPEDLPRFYNAIADNRGEFINGCRLIYPMEKQAMRALNLLGNKFFGLVFTWLLNQRFKDTLCGTKVLSKKHYEEIVANRSYFGEFDPFGDFDLIFGAAKLGLKVVEIPVRYQERKYGSTNIQRFRHGWLLLRMCLFAFKKLKAPETFR